MRRKAGGLRAADLFGHFGLDARIFPQDLIGSEDGEALIVGGARCVWDDVKTLWPVPEHVVCVNDVGMYWPGPVRHWYSNDRMQLSAWAEGRRRWWAQKFRQNIVLHSCFSGVAHQHHWPFPPQGGSGIVALLVALGLGYKRLHVAGIPLDSSGHFFDPPAGHPVLFGRATSNFDNETRDRTLQNLKPLLQGRLRVASGRLKDLE